MLAFPTWGLLPLSLAALLWAAGPTRWWERSLIALLLFLGLALVVPATLMPFDAAIGAYTVFAAAAFAGGSLVAPGGALRQALRAALWGVAGTGALGLLLRGRGFWSEFHWSTVREMTTIVSTMTAIVITTAARLPNLATLAAGFVRFAPRLVQFLADVFPAFLLLSTLAALLLAWQWHVRISRQPLGLPLGPFREFRFGDHWVWGLVLALVIWAVPKLTALKWVAVNIALVLGALYVLRGTAVVVAVAAAVGMPAWVLMVGAAAAGALVLPIFMLVPGLWTLGVFDTWLAFRQRRYSRSPTP
ncbi:MAG TPA: DUF2232 domain-containing protein [Gemmatimonadales bacterium]|nr:DUF2232 domain-containing protein [Gemmatimonadales bacterium]